MKNLIYAALLSVAALLGAEAHADGVPLFTSILPQPQESTLSAWEAKGLAAMRARSSMHTNVVIVAINNEALSSPVITLTTPGGKPSEYIGSGRVVTTTNLTDTSSPKAETGTTWQGSSATGGRLTITAYNGQFVAKIREPGKPWYMVSGLSKRYALLSEVVKRPLTEPPEDPTRVRPAPRASPQRPVG